MSLMAFQNISWAKLAIYWCKCFGSSLERRWGVVSPTPGLYPQPTSRTTWVVSLIVKPVCGKVPAASDCQPQRHAPAGPAKAGSLSVPVHFLVMACCGTRTTGAGLHRVISGSQSHFLLPVIMRCTKKWQGERWRRGRVGKKIKKSFALLKWSEIRPPHLAFPYPQEFLYFRFCI